jgi:hypothetical protein
MLWLPDASGNEGWCDHDSFAMLRDDWPPKPYPQVRRRTVVALVNGRLDSGATALARGLAVELGVPLFSRGGVGDVGPDLWWTLLADSPVGGVVVGRFGPQDARSVAEGLRRAGMNPEAVPEILCSPEGGAGPDGSLGLGPPVVAQMGDRGYPDDRASRADVVRLALLVRAGPFPASET